MSQHFSDNRSPDWKANHDKWQFALDHYEGTYVDPGKISNYLFQKMQREGNKAFESRLKDPDPILHFATAIDGINGILSAKSSETKREWGALGEPDKEGSIAYALKKNADGQGTNWEPLFKQVGIKQTVMHTLWGLVEGIEKDSDNNTVSEASVKIIDPQSVVDYFPRTGNSTQVLVKEKRETRQSIQEDGELKDVYTLFELGGWKRFVVREEKTEGGETVQVEEILATGEYEYYESSKREIRVLPVFKVKLPLPRMVGYLLAKKQNHIFNFKSSRDHGASNMSFALLKLVSAEEQYNAITDSLVRGDNTLRQDPDISGNGHEFMSPDSSYLNEAGEILKTDVEHFYHNAFKEFGDVARQATATEILQMSSTGIEAFLALLVSSIDEFENQCFLRLLQVYFPTNPSVWGSAFVERSTDFQPSDVEEELEKMKKRFFGESPVPVPNKQKTELVKKLLEKEGIAIEQDQELTDHLDRSLDLRTAEAISRLSGQAISTEEMVRTLRPGWDDAKVNAEVAKINEQSGAAPVPGGMMGD